MSNIWIKEIFTLHVTSDHVQVIVALKAHHKRALSFRAVLKSEYPLVSVDGFQPIVDVFTGHERGQLKLLLALGTQVQVRRCLHLHLTSAS